MKTKIMAVLAGIVASIGWNVEAQTYDTNNEVVSTFAGSGFSGHVDGQGTQTMFNYPQGIVADTSSNLFVLDGGGIRKITPNATVSTFVSSFGPAFNWGQLAIDHANTIWASQQYQFTYGLVRAGNNGNVTWIPLSGLSSGNDGVCADSGNNIYIADSNANKIFRYRTNGVLEVFAGSGNSGSTDGNGIFTSFSGPGALAADAADNIYVWDSGLIRKINQNKDVVTVSGKKGVNTDADGYGTNASFSSISGMCVDTFGNLLIACGSSIRKMDTAGKVVTLAGNFLQTGYADGAGNIALFNGTYKQGVCMSGGSIYVADYFNQRIRSITNYFAPQIISGANLVIGTYAGVTITGTVGRTYQIQSSPNTSAWITNVTLQLNSSPYLWIDINPIAGNKFYRAVMLP
jgi:hypothetical protein